MARTGSCDYAWLQGRLVNQGTKLLDYDEPEPVTSPESGHITPHTLFLWVAINSVCHVGHIYILHYYNLVSALLDNKAVHVFTKREKKHKRDDTDISLGKEMIQISLGKEMIQISRWEKR